MRHRTGYASGSVGHGCSHRRQERLLGGCGLARGGRQKLAGSSVSEGKADRGSALFRGSPTEEGLPGAVIDLARGGSVGQDRGQQCLLDAAGRPVAEAHGGCSGTRPATGRQRVSSAADNQ
ncbi:vegetative cell wall protein gp1-like [Iris pallida]|uniref:Vegetative cell wall protein gp1-like n=1 Tax=Iris pallida TaxID=29817 RepID=A0AAX6E1L0_IRIPA|nr:vegetative cell wall protein gp1-like [Iris pallida]